jgi:2'-5' RNA ligase
VTLRFLGNQPADPAWPDRLAEAGRVVAEAGPRPKRLGVHVWVLPVEGLAALADVVAGPTPLDPVPAASDAGPARPFVGHLTLARSKRRDGLRELPTPEISWRWEVEEVTLVASELHRDGARYTILERWALPAR